MNSIFQQVIVEILLVIILIIGTALVTYVTKWVRAQVELLKSRASSEQLTLVQSLIEIGVKSAEQSGLIGIINDVAESKKQFVVEFVQKALRARNLDLIADDVDLIKNAIESAILNGVHKGNAYYIEDVLDFSKNGDEKSITLDDNHGAGTSNSDSSAPLVATITPVR